MVVFLLQQLCQLFYLERQQIERNNAAQQARLSAFVVQVRLRLRRLQVR